jgi:hypothetical protein
MEETLPETMTKVKEEGYKLLNYLGVAEEVQYMFSSVIHEEPSGKFIFYYRDNSDEMVDKEHFTMKSFKPAASGMAVCSPSSRELITDMYVSDSLMSLIAYCHFHFKRRSFRQVVFCSTGLKPEKRLFLRYWKEYNKAKIHLLFGNSILGRVLDCKLAHWVRGEDHAFYLHYNQIISSSPTGKSITMPRERFSMRSYFRRIGGRNLVTTHKPSLNSIDNYINLLTHQTIQS